MKQILHVGDYVVMNDKYHVGEQNKGRIFMVRSSVQEIGGTPCVFLRNYTGAYAVDGLSQIFQADVEDALKLRIGAERVEELQHYSDYETNDEETQEWRDDLTDEETLLVDFWDRRYAEGLASILQSMKEKDKNSSGEPRVQGVVYGDMVWHK